MHITHSLQEAIVEAALDAARAVMAIYATEFDVISKADDSPVTAADRKAEEIITAALHRAAPDIPMVAEEAYAEGRVPPRSNTYFCVDPVDGTREFVARNGEFTVNIALIHEGRTRFGVIVAPALVRAWVGGAGLKAWTARLVGDGLVMVDHLPLRVRERPPGGLTIVSSRSRYSPESEPIPAGLKVLTRRRIGSSLKFCMVAEGEADLYARARPIHEWDVAAGCAIIEGAGGFVSAPDGSPLTFGQTPTFQVPGFIATGSWAFGASAT